MGEKLTFAQARSFAEPMRNWFRAFEKVHEVLLAAVEADVFLRKAKKEIPTLKSRLEELAEEHKEKLDAFESLDEVYKEEKAKFDADLAAFREKVDREKEALKKEHADFKEHMSDVREDIKTEHKEWLEKVEEERLRTLAGLEEAKAKVTDYLKKMGSV